MNYEQTKFRCIKTNKRPFILTFTIIIVVFWIIGYSNSISVFFVRSCVGMCVVYSLLKGIQEKDLMNPYIYFSLTPLSLLLYNENISNWYFNELTISTWGLGVINFFAFLLALSLTNKKNKNHFTAQTFNRSSNRILVQHSWILFFLGEFSFVYSFILHRPFFMSNILSYFVFPAIALAWKSRNKTTIISMYLFVGFTFIYSFNKTILLSYILITAISYKKYFAKNKHQTKRLYIGLTIAGLFFLFVAFPMKALIQEQNNFSLQLLLESIKSYFRNSNGEFQGDIIWNAHPILRMPYMYLVSAWNNVQYIMETQSNLTYGLWFFKPLISWLQFDHLFYKEYELIPYSNFNTFTYVTVLYKDFGIVGSAFGSCFLGFFVGIIYNRFKISNSAFDVAIYAIVSQATLEMFFSNHFFMLSYPFTIVIICKVYKNLFSLSREF